jgi:plasmid maintenance system killer protein
MYGYTVHFPADENSEDQAARLKALYRKRRFPRIARRPREAYSQCSGLSDRRFEHREPWRVHLAGDRAGTWSISVSGNWRITFTIERGEITNLDLEDYH